MRGDLVAMVSVQCTSVSLDLYRFHLTFLLVLSSLYSILTRSKVTRLPVRLMCFWTADLGLLPLVCFLNFLPRILSVSLMYCL